MGEVCFLSTEESEPAISEVSPEYVARRVALANHFERFPFTSSEVAMEFAGLRRMDEDSVSREEDLLAGVFSRTRCTALNLPPHASGEEVDRVRKMWEEA